MRFIVMGNIFNAGVPMHQQYDLKGSRQGRFVRDKARALIWKDLDLDVELQLPEGWKARLDRQLTADAAFLCAQHVMDYSMLMGIHYKNRDQVRPAAPCSVVTGGIVGLHTTHISPRVQALAPDGAAERAVQELQETKRHYMSKITSWNLPDEKAKDIIFIVHAQLRRKQKRAQIVAVRALGCRICAPAGACRAGFDGVAEHAGCGAATGAQRGQRGAGVSARRGARAAGRGHGGQGDTQGDWHCGGRRRLLWHHRLPAGAPPLGLLCSCRGVRGPGGGVRGGGAVQAYSSFKKAEHALKSVRYDSKSISVVNPELYAQRFTDFMQESVFQ